MASRFTGIAGGRSTTTKLMTLTILLVAVFSTTLVAGAPTMNNEETVKLGGAGADNMLASDDHVEPAESNIDPMQAERLFQLRQQQQSKQQHQPSPQSAAYILYRPSIGGAAMREYYLPRSMLYQGEGATSSSSSSSSLRPRRYAFPVGNQSFLRFGRAFALSHEERYKRPRESKDTAFLRFGRSAGGNSRGAIFYNNSPPASASELAAAVY